MVSNRLTLRFALGMDGSPWEGPRMVYRLRKPFWDRFLVQREGLTGLGDLHAPEPVARHGLLQGG